MWFDAVWVFSAITDGRHTSNDTANFDIQSASHETTKPLRPCTGCTGVYIQIIGAGNQLHEAVSLEIIFNIMLISYIGIINISYLCWANYCMSPVVHGRLAYCLLVSMLTAASLCYQSKEGRFFSGIVFLGIWQWQRIGKPDVYALCWRWAFSPKSCSMLLYPQSVALWDLLLQLFPKYMSLFFPLLHLKVLGYKVLKVQGVCLYYSILQCPNRMCLAFYVHDCIRWVWKNCGIKFGETSTQHPAVGPEHLSGRHVAGPSSFNCGSLQRVLCSSMVLQEIAFAA